MLNHRIDAYNAALLPYQKPEVIRSQVERVKQALLEIEHGPGAVAELEKENADYIAAQQKRHAELIARRKGKGLKKRRSKPRKARSIK